MWPSPDVFGLPAPINHYGQQLRINWCCFPATSGEPKVNHLCFKQVIELQPLLFLFLNAVKLMATIQLKLSTVKSPHPQNGECRAYAFNPVHFSLELNPSVFSRVYILPGKCAQKCSQWLLSFGWIESIPHPTSESGATIYNLPLKS